MGNCDMLRHTLWFTSTFLLFVQCAATLGGTAEDYKRADKIRKDFPDALKASTFNYKWCDHGLIFEHTKMVKNWMAHLLKP